jgi:hypothetical protein
LFACSTFVFGAGDPDSIRDYAAELVNLGFEAIFVVDGSRWGALT